MLSSPASPSTAQSAGTGCPHSRDAGRAQAECPGPRPLPARRRALPPPPRPPMPLGLLLPLQVAGRARVPQRSGPRWRALPCGRSERHQSQRLHLRQHLHALTAERPRPPGSPSGRKLRARGAHVPFGPCRNAAARTWRPRSSSRHSSSGGLSHAQRGAPRAWDGADKLTGWCTLLIASGSYAAARAGGRRASQG